LLYCAVGEPTLIIAKEVFNLKLKLFGNAPA
jgi:hypothetical protein